jgi:hypothetical protein
MRESGFSFSLVHPNILPFDPFHRLGDHQRRNRKKMEREREREREKGGGGL